MACTFIETNSGVEVRDKRGLYQEALNDFGDTQQAIDIIAISQSIGSINLNEIKAFIAQVNGNQNTLNPIQIQDLRDSLMSMEVSSIEEAQVKLNQAFYTSENLFNPTQQSLLDSGLYSQYEALSIINDVDLQLKIKSSLEALNNSEYDSSQFDEYVNLETTLEKTNIFNSFGKLSNINPYVVEQIISDTLANSASRQQFDDNLQDLEYQNIDPDRLYSEMQQLKRAEIWEDVDGIIRNSTPQTDTLANLQLGKIVTGNTDIIRNIEYIRDLSDQVIFDNIEQVQLILDDVEQNAAQEGLDLIGLKLRADSANLKPFLTSLEQFLLTPTQEITENFTDVYNDFFEVDTTPKTLVIRPSDINRNYVRLDTLKSEETILNEHSLLKVEEGLYMKIRRQPLDKLYAIVESYNNFPNLIQEVQNRVGQLDTVENGELTEELILNKMYFDLPLNISSELNIAEQENNQDIFDGNLNYLQNEFIADFNIAAIREKYKDSDLWKNFYNNFYITNKGLSLRYTDPITISNLKSWMNEISPKLAKDLGNYSLMSKDMPALIDNNSEDIITSKDSVRALAVNYPQTINKIQQDSYRIDEENLIAKNATEDFIRIGNRVYEAIEAKGNMTLYTILPENNANYNIYSIAQPTSSINLQDYTYLETTPTQWTKEKNIKTRQEKNIIQEQNYNC